ncbi:cytochrome b/b6 domain-containing protein [Abyssibius alkaniclasticus]|mgnify:FL=1|uniref:cytochrome b n=1 Tax=Abyssibius alkaniclasticus TaxID=2881234 RepID=UPI0023634C77|nr:cytochrome b/b6 domain-containing protein [Abyssibius alkaniclasticus]UPH71693.1 cytochrome b/b6 domain-containing protein [Abyssibius alkaniclasticus]
MSKPQNYARSQIILHWLILLLIAFNLIAPDGMNAMYRAARRGSTPSTTELFLGNLHIIVGITVLVLAVLRLVLRIRNGAPAAPAGPRLQQLAGHVVHWGIYVLLFAVPLSGMSGWFAGISAAATGHVLLQNLLLGLVALHVAAALYHQLWVKDNLLARMWPRR